MKHQLGITSLLVMTALLLGFNPGAFAAEGNGGYDAPYFQADFVQDLSDWSSALVNPALLYRVNQMHLDFGIYRWAVGPDRLGYQHIGFQYPIRKNHTLGITLLPVSNTIPFTTVDKNTLNPSTDGQIVHYLDLWTMVNYAWRIQPWLAIGGNLKYRIQNQFDTSNGLSMANIPGIDLGIYLNPMDHYRFGDVGLSLCVQDVVPTQIKWNSENPEITVTRARAGIRYSALNDNLVADVELLLDNALVGIFKNWKDYTDMYQAQDAAGQVVGELQTVARYGLHVKYMFIPQIWLKGGWTNNNIPYVGFNYNLIYPLPEMINYINIDYHLGYSFLERSGRLADERGFTMMGKVSTDFGPTREQRESKRLYDKLILAPMDAYNEAMRLYLAGKYWEASFAFGKVLSLFPNFHLNDKATWYMGNCYRFLYMNDIARQVYKEALEEYTTTEMRSKYLYGLESLDYREAKYDDALKNHAFITNLYGESDIRPDADYVAGEIHFLRKNYNVAEQLFSRIQPGDPSYLYAQYTLSIINIDNNKEAAAIQNLSNVIKDSTQEQSDQLLQDASNLKIGHIYFEQGDKLRNAVEAYQRIPETSPYGDEALLATAWSWIKVNQPAVALQTTDRLLASHPESPMIPENYLVRGYALMLLKRYAEAGGAFNQSIDGCKKSFVTEDDLKTRKSQFDQTETQFLPVSDKIKKNALRKPTNKTVEERQDMEKDFQKFSKDSKEFFSYTLLAKSHTRFFKRKDEIMQDAEYALAKAENMMKSKKQNNVIQEHKTKENKIDQELEKLKKELDQSNGK